MGRQEVLQRLIELHTEGRSVLGVIGAGTLGKNFVETAIQENAGNILLFNRTFDKAMAIVEDQIQGMLGHSINYGVRIEADSEETPGTVIESARIVRDEQTLVYQYATNEDDKPLYAIVTSDPRVVAAMAPLMLSVYYTLGRSAHQGGEVQIDRNLSLKDNIAIVSDMVPKLGLAHAKEAIHIVTSNPDNVIVDAYQQITGLSPKQVAAVGVSVDSVRLAQTLADELDVGLGSVHNPVVLGNHGFDMVAVPEQISIGNRGLIEFATEKFAEYGTTDSVDVGQFFEEVREKAAKAGGKILFGKNEGTAHGPAQVAIKLAKMFIPRFMSDLGKKPVELIASIKNPVGANGVDDEVFLGHMVKIDKDGMTPVEIELTDQQRDALKKSARELNETMNLPIVTEAIASARAAVEKTPRLDLYRTLRSGTEFERPGDGGGRATG